MIVGPMVALVQDDVVYNLSSDEWHAQALCGTGRKTRCSSMVIRGRLVVVFMVCLAPRSH